MKKIYIGTNTKMYMDIRRTTEYLRRLWALTEDIARDRLELFVIPSYTTLDAARKCVPQAGIHIGAQNMAWKEQGQFTNVIKLSPSKQQSNTETRQRDWNTSVRCLLCVDEDNTKKTDCHLPTMKVYSMGG